jgi:ribose/xylose/arabinose/galactoside ABC-type transport system permease subunit
MEREFTPLGKLVIGDWTRGLIVAVLGAVLTVVYQAIANGLPTNWTTWEPILISAAGVGITSGIAYILKNLGTGSNGQILTNAPPPLPVEKK